MYELKYALYMTYITQYTEKGGYFRRKVRLNNNK